jgi:ABC-type glycerol-3-phosphate transport system substrate-binding protein
MTADEKTAAKRFMAYLYSPAAQALLSESTGYFPVTRAAFGEASMVKRYGPAGAYARLHDNLPNATAKLMTFDNLKVRAIVKAAIDRTLDEGMPAGTSQARAQREASGLLGK